MTKVKLISCLSMLALSLSMLVMGVLALATQTITLTGEVGFNVSDKSVYVKDARISDETIAGFMPGYINDGLILSDATISGSSFEISLDVINTTTNNFDIVIESSQSGVSVTTEAYIPANSTDLTEITSSTPITETIVLTVTNSTSSPVDLTNILIKIKERTFAVLDGFVFRSNGTGTGELVSYSGSASNVDIPDTYSTMEENGETIFIEGDNYTVTAIASGSQSSYAFQNATNMTSDNIPTTVTSIGDYAFYNRSGLTTANFPSALTSIGSYAFYGCSNLASNFSISSSLRTVSTYAFYNCKKLTSNGLNLSNLTSLGTRAFYNCSSLTGSLTLPTRSGIADYVFYNCSGLTGDLTIHTSTIYIGTGAFEDCSGLDGTLTLPTNVEVIFAGAFSGCTSLKSAGLNLSNIRTLENYAFRNCEAMTGTLVLPNISTIPQYAFYNCNFTGTLNLPSSVRTISSYAFYSNNFSGTLNTNNVETIGTYAFANLSNITTLTLNTPITSIESNAFRYMYSLTKINYNISSLSDLTSRSHLFYNAGSTSGGITVDFGSNVTRIPAYLFSASSFTYRPRIETVNIPSSVTYIGRYAFQNCTSLTEANFDTTAQWYYTSSSTATSGTNIPSTDIASPSTAARYLRLDYVSYYWKLTPATILEGFVFDGNTLVSYSGSATNVEIPSSYSIVGDLFVEGDDYTVTAIGDNAFSSCTFTSITIPEGVTSIGDNAFDSCAGLTSITIPEGVTSIGDSAFSYCESLSSVTFEGDSKLTSIDNNAFAHCAGLTSITIPEGVTSIGDSAFSYCDSLTSITIPEGVTSIGNRAFWDCDNLSSITFSYDEGWYVTEDSSAISGTDVDLSNAATNAELLTSSAGYADYYLKLTVYNDIFEFEGDMLTHYYGDGGATTDIVIPSSYSIVGGNFVKGSQYQVTTIDVAAFEWDTYTNSIVISEGITNIGTMAFQHCENKKSFLTILLSRLSV